MRSSSFVLFFASAALAVNLCAVQTRFWSQTDQSDFEKGTLTNISLRSDGRLFVSPEFREVFDPSTPYLWALATDRQGNVYAGGGGAGSGTTKLFVIDKSGKGKPLAELEGLEIHALAVGPDGQIYAATDPDGKIYKVSPQGGKPQVFYDPHAKYIWAIAFNRAGDLFVATGDQGEVHRVTRDGHGSVFYKTGETHARSLVIDGQGSLIIGTEPGGLVIRVDANGAGFVLCQLPRREVTAVAISKMGEIYAAGVGTRSGASAPQAPPPPLPPTAMATINISASGSTTVSPRPPTAPTQPTSLPTPPPGSVVYRIGTDGAPKRIWSHPTEIVYALSFDQDSHPLVATGNRGKIYRLDSDTLYTELIDASPTQITSFATTDDGRIYVATGNIGRIYELGKRPAAKGVFESEVLDADAFAYWGRLALRGTPKAATVSTRSGNLNRPSDHWSAWAALKPDTTPDLTPCPRCLSGRVQSPSARFLQYRIELSSAEPGAEVASVDIAYQNKNVAPAVNEIEVTPANYKFPAPSTAPAAPNGPPASISLSPINQHKAPGTSSGLDLSGSQTLTYAKGIMGARWSAQDENGDTLLYTVQIRGTGESDWKLLKDKVREHYISFDSTAFPDGEYQIRVTASDGLTNTPDEALTGSLVSDPFDIDNTPPRIIGLSWAPGGGKLQVRWKARDALSLIDRAEYSINGGEWIRVEPVTKLSDSPEEEYILALDRQGSGEQTIAVRVTDANENQAVDKVIIK